MYRSVIIPIIAVIALTVQAIFGIEIDENVQAEIAAFIGNGIALGLVVYGIVKGQREKLKKVKKGKK